MPNTRRISDGPRRLRNWYRSIRPGWKKNPPTLNEDGAALVEFTVAAPLFFLIVFGMIEWGSIYWLQNNMVNASREGARAVAVQGAALGGGTPTAPPCGPGSSNATACCYLSGAGQSFTITTTDLCTGNGSTTQDVMVQISVDAAKASLFNYLGMFTGVTFSSATKMRKELACTGVGVASTCTCNTAVSPPTCN